ncbi:hypothetical protein FHR92_005308 [Fontibacillus solani]|uniref:RNA polymerase subunit sigma-24 n=1 Tax=Fontibacillus solani TaxID=1572857 RepID=A0A7W3XUJ4_9BACL|nr:RNA polymerase subunit sigma-24 [Fontibacillus solani]MBA9088775.1 hypothetical protein [Fontibacillus solani]
MTEQTAIERLSQYRQKQARIQVLSTYSVGAGITVSRLNEDDQLQELHAKLRKLPSYMYLSGYEQKIEQVANAYMTRYPAGVRAQQQAVPVDVMDEEDRELLHELRDKIAKVIAARGYEVRSDIDAILTRLTELQDLQADIQRLDFILDRLQEYKPYDATLLRYIYVDGKNAEEVQSDLGISKRSYWRKIAAAEREYTNLAR